MNDRIAKVMSKALEVPSKDINEHTTQDDIDTWDSLHHIKMIVLLEREFNIEIPEEETGNMVSYKLIELIVNRHEKA